MRTEGYWRLEYGVALSDLRKIFFAGQDQRCACCRMQVEFMGMQSSYDKITKTIICRKCRMSIVSLRKLPATLIPKLLEFVNGNFSLNNKKETAGESPATGQGICAEHKGNFPP